MNIQIRCDGRFMHRRGRGACQELITTKRLILILFAFLGLVRFPSTSQAGEFVVDTNTLFLAHFNDTTAADFAKGSVKHFLGTAGLTQGGGGKYGEALVCQQGMVTTPEGRSSPYSQLCFTLDDNIDLRKGTLEFWIKCNFSRQVVDPKNSAFYYLFDIPSKINEDNGILKRMALVVREAMETNGRTKRYFHYCAYDVSGTAVTISDNNSNNGVEIHWQADEWHHVAATWDDGEMVLFLDGVKKKVRPFSKGLFGSDRSAMKGTFWIGGLSNSTDVHEGCIDELRISDIVRYSDDFEP